MRKRQAGFTAVEAIMIVLVVLALAAGGWYIWQKKATDSKSSASTTETTAQTNEEKASGDEDADAYITIKEWGVRFKLDGTTKDGYYAIKENEPNYAFVSLKSLTDPECAPNKTSVGLFTRFQKDDVDPISGQPYLDLVGADAKKVGNYYYFFTHAQAYCDESAQPKLEAAAKSFDNSVDTAEVTTAN